MRELLTQALDEVRAWFGWKDLAETRLSPAHGWLLESTAQVRKGHAPEAGVTDSKARPGRS